MSWEWLRKVDRFIFDPDRVPRHLGHAIIQEYDASNRTGDVRLGFWKGTLHGLPPAYRREYGFELPVRYSPHRYEFFLEHYPILVRGEEPILEFKDYVLSELRGQAIGAMIGKYFFSVSLTREADAQWQQSPPTDFYGHLIEFYKTMHPPVVGCVVRQATGVEYPSAPDISELPPGPV